MRRLIGALAVAVLVSCGGDTQSEPAVRAELPAFLTRTDHGPAEYVLGQPAPGFALPVLTGEGVSSDRVRVSDFAGQVVVLNFWNSGCAPCVAEHETLNRVAEKYEGEIQYLGINFGDSPGTFAAYEARHGAFSYPNLQDVRDEIGKAYERTGWPLHVVIDREGAVAWWRPAGPIREATLSAVIDDVLAGERPTALTPAAYPDELGS